MDKEVLDVITKEYIDKQVNNINMTSLGYRVTDCSLMLFSIAIHCIENQRLFDKEQLVNIKNIINSFNM